MLHEVRSRIPSLSAWFECCYGDAPSLLFGDHILHSCCGVQQGDPLGPLGFALTLQPIIDSIQREVHGLLLNGWYLDDGIIIGTGSDLQLALNIIESQGPSKGCY